MAQLSDRAMLEKLKRFDTPSITNVVATYPGKPLCLGLYEPWRQNWYTNTSVHCIYPELGPIVGYAVTIVFALPNPRFQRLSFDDVVDALGKSKKPAIVVIKQDFPQEMQSKVGLAGGQMTTLFKACGATPGHGEMAISAVNVPVSVAGMDVAPGEIIHMDENGACKFPADRLADVCKNVDAFKKEEDEQVKAINSAKTLEEIKAAFSGKKIK